MKQSKTKHKKQSKTSKRYSKGHDKKDSKRHYKKDSKRHGKGNSKCTKCKIRTLYCVKKYQNPRIILVEPIMTDNEIKKKEGDFFEEDHYHSIIKQDCDVYIRKNRKQVLLCSFRKNVIDEHLNSEGYKAVHQYAKMWHGNRGAAAGRIDSAKVAKHIGRLTQRDKFRAYYYSKKDGKFHKDHVSNLTQSNIIGFYDVADRNVPGSPPCRETKFNRDYPGRWEQVLPLLQKVGSLFKKLVPEKYKKQYDAASKTPDYQIEDTPFSTATINHNWQTALHRDKGDFSDGFGNLIVLEKGKYEGGYLGFPQYGVCIDVRQGDFLAMDVHQWHCNTSLKLLTPDASRISIVSYLRKNMIRCVEKKEN